MIIYASLLNTQYYKVRIKSKSSYSRKSLGASPNPWCSSNWKGSLQVTLDQSANLLSLSLSLLIYIYIYVYIYISSSSCRAASTDIHDPLSPLLPNIHRFWQDFRATLLYLHIAAVCMFKLVVLLLLGHMRGSIGGHHWWVRPCFSSSVQRVWFV